MLTRSHNPLGHGVVTKKTEKFYSSADYTPDLPPVMSPEFLNHRQVGSALKYVDLGVKDTLELMTAPVCVRLQYANDLDGFNVSDQRD